MQGQRAEGRVRQGQLPGQEKPTEDLRGRAEKSGVFPISSGGAQDDSQPAGAAAGTRPTPESQPEIQHRLQRQQIHSNGQRGRCTNSNTISSHRGKRGQILTPEASRRDQLRSSQALVLVQDAESRAARHAPGLRARPRDGQPPASPAAPKSIGPEQGSLGPSLHPQPTSRQMQRRKRSAALRCTSQNLCSRGKKSNPTDCVVFMKFRG